MKPCPNPNCKNNDLGVVTSDKSPYVRCWSCGVTGPFGLNSYVAVYVWDALPRFGAKLNPKYDDGSSAFDDVDSSAETEEHVRITKQKKGE